MTDDDTLADRIAEMAPGWLPISGHVVNITLTLDERDRVVSALRERVSNRQECADIAESMGGEHIAEALRMGAVMMPTRR